MTEPTRHQRWMARHMTALRIGVLCVAVVACVAATWVTLREPAWWVWLIAAGAVLNVMSTWSATGEAERAVAGSHHPPEAS
jgi:hypothetical protein